MAAQHAYDMTTGPDQAVESSDRPDSPQAAGPDSLISSLRVAVDQDVIRPESQAARASGPDSNLTENLRVDVGDEQQQHMQAMSVYGTAGRDPEQQQVWLLYLCLLMYTLHLVASAACSATAWAHSCCCQDVVRILVVLLLYHSRCCHLPGCNSGYPST